MNDALRETLREHAEEHSAPWVDVDAIVARGDHRIRRTRALAACVVGLVLIGVLLAPGRALLTTGRAPVAGTTPDPSPARADDLQPAYLSRGVGGAVLHDGRAAVHTGIASPATWARAGTAFVVFDTSGHLWRVDRTGAERVGRADVRAGVATMSDLQGSAVLWTRSSGDSTLLEGYDGAANRRLPARDLGPHSALVAVNAGRAYWIESRGLFSAPVAGGVPRPELPARPGHPVGVRDVAGRRVLLDDGAGPVTARLADPDHRRPAGDGGLLSPDGRLLASTGPWLSVLDVATGDDATPQLPAGASFQEWLGARRLDVVVPERGGARIEVCTVPSGTCRSWGRLPADAVPQASYDPTP